MEELSEAEGRQLEGHLSRCWRCQRFRRGLEKAQELLEQERTAMAAPVDVSGLWRGVRSRMDKANQGPRSPFGWMRPALAGSAAVAAACAVLAVALWFWGAGLRSEVEDLRVANARLSHQSEQLASATGRPDERLASLGPGALARSTRLYWELADFYRLPILWVVEGDRGVEMKLGSEPTVAPTSGAAEELLFLAVAIVDSEDPDASSIVRIVTRPEQRVSAELEELEARGGHWRLECVAAAAEGSRQGVALRLEHIGGGAPAVLATQVTLPVAQGGEPVEPPLGTVVEPGSVVVAGRTYTVQLFGQRVVIPAAERDAGHTKPTI